MKLLFCFLLLNFSIHHVYSGKNAQGSYLMANRYTISYIQLKKNQHVSWFVHGCAERRSDTGRWLQSGDTVRIQTERSSTTFLLINNHLCYVYPDGWVTAEESGIARTHFRNHRTACRYAGWLRFRKKSR